MAFEIGVAANHVDLWDKLLAFLTTNPDLVASGQNWTVGWQAPAGASNETDLVLVGPGMGGTDQIYVGMRRVDSPSTNHFHMEMCGVTGLLQSATSYDEHVNPSIAVGIFLNNAPMSYWFVANGRRFMAVIKISTIYESLYCGLILPYAHPLQYSYPLYIGGSAGIRLLRNTSVNYTDRSGDHAGLTRANTSNSGGGDYWQNNSPARFLSPTSDWKYMHYDVFDSRTFQLAPYLQLSDLDTGTASSYPPSAVAMLSNQRAAIGGDLLLTPAEVVIKQPTATNFGRLDGIFMAPAEECSPEDTIESNGVQHIVFPNVFRIDAMNINAMALE